jgi:hypothetical protein
MIHETPSGRIFAVDFQSPALLFISTDHQRWDAMGLHNPIL